MALQSAAADGPAPSGAPSGGMYHSLMILCGVGGALLFAAMALLVCADVLMRNLGMGNISWGVEMTEYMLMVATFMAAPWLLYLNDHIRVDIVVRGVPAPVARMLELVTDLFGFVVCAVLAWQSVVVAQDAAAQGGMVFKVLIFPEWWLNVPMAFSCTLLAVEFARRFQRSLRPAEGK
jgi:TRAP-type transport system small permease protein